MLKERREGDIVVEAGIGLYQVIVQSVPCCKDPNPDWFYKRMALLFHTDFFTREGGIYDTDYNKLGTIEFMEKPCPQNSMKKIYVVNMYTHYSNRADGPYGIPLDYDALRLCLRKLNDEFEGKTVAIPGEIGSTIAGGDQEIIHRIITEECKKIELSLIFTSDAVRRSHYLGKNNASVLQE